MLAPAAITALVVVLYVRPHEFVASLDSVPVIPALVAVGVVGFALDRDSRLPVAATRWPLAGYTVWLALSLLVATNPGDAGLRMVEVAPPLIVFVLVGGTGGGLSRLRVVGAAVAACCVLLAITAVHQSRAPRGCIAHSWTEEAGTTLTIDGRACEQRIDCYGDGSSPDHDYECERIGLFGTATVAGRAAYRGTMADPNELAVFLSIGLPLLIAVGRTGQRRRRLVVTGVIALFGFCVVLSQSRTGALVFAAVLGTYMMVSRPRLGLFAGLALAGLLATFGGRSGAEASASVDDRYEAWRAALEMLRDSPMFGVGYGNFLEHHHLTAHNSYLLVAAEQGLVGLTLWMTLLVVSLVLVTTAMRAAQSAPIATDVADKLRVWGTALLASLVGLLIAMAFLSLSYHVITWIYLGLAAAYFSAAQNEIRGLTVRCGARELALAATGALSLVVACEVLLRTKGF